jgi:phage tail-like protein
MAPIVGNPRNFFRRFSFRVELDAGSGGPVYAGFSKCSELSVEIARIDHWEGGSLIPNKSPGRLTFSDVTLERGATNDRALYDWLSEVVSVAAGLIGLPDPAYERNLDIVQLDRDGLVVRRWSLYNAWPMKFVAGDWDNTADEVLIESVALTYDYFQLSPLAS